MLVTFINAGRTGNNIFQYMATLLFSIRHNYKYVPYDKFPNEKNHLYVNDKNIIEVLSSAVTIPIICEGWFQDSRLFINYRKEIIERIYSNTNNDYWTRSGNRYFVRQYMSSVDQSYNEDDIYISLRLDDFIQNPCATSDIVPPEFYVDLIENYGQFNRLFIICDKIRNDWERQYIQYFSKWNPILFQNSLEQDCMIMRECPVLIHSNSTLCWIMSFLSKRQNKRRIIPITNFYKHQYFGVVDETTDRRIEVSPLSHSSVYALNYRKFLQSYIYPLSYCAPDEIIVKENDLEEIILKKKEIVAALIPGESNTYLFKYGEEKEYYKMYRDSFFAHTCKKGGWDCLRHYEIMANVCLPLFRDLNNCPKETMTTLPKALLLKIYERFVDPRNINFIRFDPENIADMADYSSLLKEVARHFREQCTCSYAAKYFIGKFTKPVKNILLIRGNCGVNYSRELLWIGLKRYSKQAGGISVEFPKIEFLYDSSKETQLYGNGMTYSKRIEEDEIDPTEEFVTEKLKNHFWDLVIYGKVGPDEDIGGSIEHFPLWKDVFKHYSKNEIAFLYGGDGCQNFKTGGRYLEHLMKHAQFGHCFVRELDL